MLNPCLSAFRIAGIYFSALYDGDPIKRHSIFLASDLLVSPRGIVPCKCTDWGLNKRWRGGGAEDAKDERAGRKGTFQSSDFPEYMGVKKVSGGIFSSSRVKAALANGLGSRQYASSLQVGYSDRILGFSIPYVP